MNPLFGSLASLVFDLLKKRRFLKETVLPLVRTADGRLMGNTERRQAVVAALMDRGLSEGEARLLTEAGVKLLRRLQAKAAKKAARKAKKAGIDVPDRPATLHRPDLGEPPE